MTPKPAALIALTLALPLASPASAAIRTETL